MPRPSRPAALAALAAILLAAAPDAAQAWGRLGHRASARLAEARLSPAAKAAVKELLGPGESLADASTWPDEIRRERPETGPWHYVNVPITEPHYDPRFCPGDKGCVVSSIHEMERVLADRDAPKEKRRDALRFLVHFLQDMHQPVHVGDRRDRGGNDLQVQFFDQGSNLHRVWDSGLIERHSADENAWVRELEALATPEASASWAKGTVEGWADESLQAAKRAYLVPGTEEQLGRGAKLGRPYLDANLATARLRVAQSGVRVAEVLNGIFR